MAEAVDPSKKIINAFRGMLLEYSGWQERFR